MQVSLYIFNDESSERVILGENDISHIVNYDLMLKNDNKAKLSLKLDKKSNHLRIINNTCNTITLVLEGEKLNDLTLWEKSSIEVLYEGYSVATMIVFFFDKMNTGLYSIVRGEYDVSVGRGLDNVICCIGEEFLSEHHLNFFFGSECCSININGRNGCYLNGSFLSPGSKKQMFFGDVVDLWSARIVFLSKYILVLYYIENISFSSNDKMIIRLQKYDNIRNKNADMTYKNTEYGVCHVDKNSYIERKNQLYIVPVPRNRRLMDEDIIRMDAPPEKQTIRSRPAIATIGPAFTMAIPMAVSSFIAIFYGKQTGARSSSFMYTGIITACLSAILGVLWGSVNIKNERRMKKYRERKRKNTYKEYARQCEEKVFIKYRNNMRNIKQMYPSVREIINSGEMNGLWNHLPGDDDFLNIRVGTGNIKYYPPIDFPESRFHMDYDLLKDLPDYLRQKYSYFENVPVCVNLKEEKNIGMICNDDSILSEFVSVIILQLCCLISPLRLRMAIYALGNRKLDVSHLRFLPHLMGSDSIYLCNDSNRISEFNSKLLNDILHLTYNGELPIWMIFTDDIRNIPANIAENKNVKCIVIGRDYSDINTECHLILQNSREFRGMFDNRKLNDRIEISFDRMNLNEQIKCAKSIAKYKISHEPGLIPIPGKISIEEVYREKNDIGLSFDCILNAWHENVTLNDLKIPIGMSENRTICFLDMHEKAHGPHGLIAGMTGSGKSELLETIILMLSLKYSPKYVNFFLIDYKGGGMANLFEKLPHLCGCITNLSGNMTARAMLSIKCENERRQKIFLENNVNSITEYERLYHNKLVADMLPHIFIIIDEFAELKKNEPEFMREIISVAQVGRSLGIHLILATQKPSGTVDDNIWSNSRFRICLRVQTRQDSMDMLRKPDAANLTNPGRAYLQVGNDELYEEFQGIYAMSSIDREYDISESVLIADKDGFFRKMNIERSGVNENIEPNSRMITQYEKAMEIIADVHKVYESNPVRMLWQPPLGEKIYLNEMEVPDVNQSGRGYIVGLIDDPQSGCRYPLKISCEDYGNYIICGMQGSGKSNFLITYLYQIVASSPIGSHNIYIIDMNRSIPEIIKESYMCGGYFDSELMDRVGSLFHYLIKNISERIKKKSDNYTEILLIIDGYGEFRNVTNEKYDLQMIEILKRGPGVGVHCILTGNMIGNGEIPTKVHELCKQTISLNMIDKMHYLQAMRLGRISVCPEDNISGRGIVCIDGRILEFQTALISEKPGDDLRKLICLRNGLYEGNEDLKTNKIPIIPKKPVMAQLMDRINNLDSAVYREKRIPIGYEKETGEIYFIPTDITSKIIITGRRGFGKKNLMRVIKETSEFVGYTAVYAENAEEFLRIAEEYALSDADEDRKRLILCESIGAIVNDIYSLNDSNTEERFIKILQAMSECENANDITAGKIKLAVICTRDDEKTMMGRPVLRELLSKAVGINLGGMNDEQRMFSYEYLSFNERNSPKPVGTAHVSMPVNVSDEEYYKGEVIVPLWMKGS